MNWRKGLFRLWLVLSLCWFVGTALFTYDDLCAIYSLAEAERLSRWIENGGWFHEVLGEPGIYVSPALPPSLPPACFPAGDLRVAWLTRLEAFKIIGGPPLALLTIGMAVAWIAWGFRRRKN